MINSEANSFAFLMIVPTIIVIDGLGNQAHKLMADVISHEVADVHDGSVVFTAEPALSDSFLLTTNIPGVTSGDFLAGTEVLPETVFQEGLAQAHFDVAAISTDRH